MKVQSLFVLTLWLMASSQITLADPRRDIADSGDETLPMIGDPAPNPEAGAAEEPVAPAPIKAPRKAVKANPFSAAPVAASPSETSEPSDNSSLAPNSGQSSHSTLHLGIEGGLSLGSSSFNINGFNPTLSSQMRTGFAGGVFAEVDLSDNISLMPEVLYIQKGGRYSTLTDVYQLNWDSLEIPLLVEGKFGTDAAKFVIFAGPAVSIAVNQTLVDNYFQLPPTYYLKTYDIGVHAGLGGEFAVTPQMKVFLNGRYMQGFINQAQTYGVTQYLSGFLFMTGLSFGL
jgi:Outer membrane protein beta-barrel domain